MAMARAHPLTLVPTCGRCRALRMSAMRLRYVARSIGPLQSVTPTESPVATRTVFLIAQTGKPNRHHAGLRGHPPHAAQAFGGVLRREGEPDVERGDETALRVPLLAALTGSVSMWLRGLDLNQRPLGSEGVGGVHSGRHPTEGAGISAPPFRLVGRLSDGQPGKCTESSSGQPGHFTERPSVRREPALLASVVSPKTRLGPPLASNGPTAVVGNGAMTPALLTIPSAFENLSRPI